MKKLVALILAVAVLLVLPACTITKTVTVRKLEGQKEFLARMGEIGGESSIKMHFSEPNYFYAHVTVDSPLDDPQEVAALFEETVGWLFSAETYRSLDEYDTKGVVFYPDQDYSALQVEVRLLSKSGDLYYNASSYQAEDPPMANGEPVLCGYYRWGISFRNKSTEESNYTRVHFDETWTLIDEETEEPLDWEQFLAPLLGGDGAEAT